MILEKIEMYLNEEMKSINESGWLKQGNIYTAWASDIEGFFRKKHKDPRCPKCRNDLTQDAIFQNPHRDRDHDIEYWDGKCPICGAGLKTFND